MRLLATVSVIISGFLVGVGVGGAVLALLVLLGAQL